MLDMVFAVDNPMLWHTENLKMNWDHYSGLKHLGSQAIGFVQNRPPCVYFNTMIKWEDQVSNKINVQCQML